MTNEELTERVNLLEATLTDLVRRNEQMDQEHEMVIQMTRRQRRLFATMSPAKRHEYLGAYQAEDKEKCRALMVEAYEAWVDPRRDHKEDTKPVDPRRDHEEDTKP
jgi:hypothetical protein